jgi:carbon-monoxide dehydrogenase medium subunit
MDYFRPETLEQAIGLLSGDEEARCLAGGQTLVAMMNTRILTPSRVVSLRGLPGLGQVERLPDGSLRVGAMATHAAMAGLDVSGAHRLLPETARQIASPAIRAFGTIGGSLCHADPAADWPVALLALDAQVGISGPDGNRTEPVDAFIVDALTTSLAPGEIVTHLTIPPASAGSAGAYVKLARVEGDFATAAIAVTLDMSGDTCNMARIVVGGCAPVPVRNRDAESVLAGTPLGDAELQAAGERLAAALEPEDDGRASAAYRRQVVPGLVRRAIRMAAVKS